MGCASSSPEGPSLPINSSQTRIKNLSLPTTTIATTTFTSATTSSTKTLFGKCVHCSSPYVSPKWCRNCAFPDKEKWTTGNTSLDNFISYTQEVSPDYETYLEWIPFEQFINVKELKKGYFSTTFEAIWTEGPKRNFDSSNRKWCRIGNTKVFLKLLRDSQQITEDYLNEVSTFNLIIEFLFFFLWY